MLQAMASLGSYVESGEQIWCWRLIKPTWSVGYVTFGCIEKYVTGQVQFSTSERKGITTNGWNWVKITKSADALHWLNLAMVAMYVTYFTNVLCTNFGSDSETLEKSTSIKQSVRLFTVQLSWQRHRTPKYDMVLIWLPTISLRWNSNSEIVGWCDYQVRGIETIATYDPSTQEFVIHTPCESAQKTWIGGAGKVNILGFVSILTCFVLLRVHQQTNQETCMSKCYPPE